METGLSQPSAANGLSSNDHGVNNKLLHEAGLICKVSQATGDGLPSLNPPSP